MAASTSKFVPIFSGGGRLHKFQGRERERRSFVGVGDVTTAQSGHCFDVEQTTTTPVHPVPKWAGVTEKSRGEDDEIIASEPLYIVLVQYL